MNQFKKVLLSAFATVAIFGTTLVSCTPDPCDPKTIVCLNGGACTDGTCGCVAGFEGTTCQTLSRDKFIGIFSGTESCTIGTDTYAITTTANSDKTKFNIQNLYNQSSVIALASANGNAFTIPNQTVSAGITASGSGVITGNTITVTYTIITVASGLTNTCTFTGTK
jgi:hypothetical protein